MPRVGTLKCYLVIALVVFCTQVQANMAAAEAERRAEAESQRAQDAVDTSNGRENTAAAAPASKRAKPRVVNESDDPDFVACPAANPSLHTAAAKLPGAPDARDAKSTGPTSHYFKEYQQAASHSHQRVSQLNQSAENHFSWGACCSANLLVKRGREDEPIVSSPHAKCSAYAFTFAWTCEQNPRPYLWQVLSQDTDDAALFGEANGDSFNAEISDDALLNMELPPPSSMHPEQHGCQRPGQFKPQAQPIFHLPQPQKDPQGDQRSSSVQPHSLYHCSQQHLSQLDPPQTQPPLQQLEEYRWQPPHFQTVATRPLHDACAPASNGASHGLGRLHATPSVAPPRGPMPSAATQHTASTFVRASEIIGGSSGSSQNAGCRSGPGPSGGTKPSKLSLSANRGLKVRDDMDVLILPFTL